MAQVVSLTAPTILKSGERGSVEITFKNIGRARWPTSGPHFTSLYHWNPKTKRETPSPFADANWSTSKRPALLAGTDVVVGQTMTLRFSLKAPATPGSYHENFILASEQAAWIKFGTVTLNIQVTGGAIAATNPLPQSSVLSPNTALATELTLPVDHTPPKLPSSADWSAELIKVGGSEWQIDPEDHTMLTLAFKNTGTKTWTNNGNQFVSLYAVDGKHERSSPFKDLSWLSASQAAKLQEPSVKPGDIGHVVLQLRAPRSPGAYRETFRLAAENTSWISGSDSIFPIRVPMGIDFIATAPPMPEAGASLIAAPITPHQLSYLAQPLIRSAAETSVVGGSRQPITVGFKNIGQETWASWSLRIKGVQPANVGGGPWVSDESWNTSFEPVKLQGQTKSGELGYLSFQIRAPAKIGSYTASFQLYANDQPVEGGVIDIPVTVTQDAPLPKPAPTNSQPLAPPAPNPPTPATNATPIAPATPTPTMIAIPLGGDASILPGEPRIRVGLYRSSDSQLAVKASHGSLTVFQAGAVICHLATGQSVTEHYDRARAVYLLTGGSCTGQSADAYQIKADDGVAPMEISDYSRPVGWLPGANDNSFRSQLELRYAPSTDQVWVINDLPIEWYLKGIAETSNSSPPQFQRTLLTAARTYAMYHVVHASKHADEFFIVDAHYDQVYRGYGAEARDPNVVAAVDATRGQIVTHDGKLAITPYYSRSDGRTRDWTEVWGGGPYPWLVSVPVPWDKGQTLWGHGVGMSATGALGMARDGKNYQEILQYFYPTTELRQAYK